MKKHSLKVFVASLLVLSTATGCAPKLGILDSEVAQTLETVRVISIIPEEQLQVRVLHAQTGGLIFGLAGVVADAAVTSGRQSGADDRLAPLLEASSDVDFRSTYWSQLKATFEKRAWPDDMTLDTRELQIPSREFRDMMGSLEEDAALVLHTEYFLSPGARVMVVKTRARLYRAVGDYNPDSNFRPTPKRAYTVDFTYFSQPVGSKKDEAAISLWAENDAKRYRACVSEGIEESMKTIRRFILEPAKVPEGTGDDKVRFVYEDPLTGRHARWKGYIISREGNRLLVHYKSDDLYSLPSDWIEAK